jgi:D-inositol-3-phosphate glycosyltransferase
MSDEDPRPTEVIRFPTAETRIAMITVHTSPVARPGGYAAGGMNVYVRETARQLGNRGISVDIFTRDDGTQPKIAGLSRNVRLISLPAGPREPLPKEEISSFLPEFLHGMRRFRQQQDLHYTLIHSHYWHGGWVATFLAPRWGVPHVAMFHTLAEVKNRALVVQPESDSRSDCERRIVAAADRIICAAEHERPILSRIYGAAAGRVSVIPCGVDLARFRPIDQAKARRQLELDPRPLVLYVGRIEPLKGLDILVEAVAQLESRDARLLVVGGDAQAEAEIRRLEQRALALGLHDRVRFVGVVDQAKLPAYYSAADVCVVPSYSESFGLVAVEAMACGTPVIASRVGGLMTTISDGRTGYLIPWHCPEPFAERIDLVLGNSELRANLGHAARRSVRRYSWDRIAAALAGEYANVCDEYNEQAAYRSRYRGRASGEKPEIR